MSSKAVSRKAPASRGVLGRSAATGCRVLAPVALKNASRLSAERIANAVKSLGRHTT